MRAKFDISGYLSIPQTLCVARQFLLSVFSSRISALGLISLRHSRCKVHHISAVQVEYNLFSLDIEQNGLLETCRELGVAVVCYAPWTRFLDRALQVSQ